MAKSIISNNPAQLVTKARANLTDFVDDGPITIEAVTTNPTKGTTTVDKMLYRIVGDTAEIEMQFHQSVVGTAGSGDYLFTLPGGLQFKSGTVFNTAATAFDSTGHYGSIELLSPSGATVSHAMVIPYDATRFRLLSGAANTDPGAASSATLDFVSSSIYPFSFGVSYKGKFSVPVEGFAGSDVTFLAPQPTQRVAYIKDVKASGVAGGTFTAGSYVTRDLNTLEGDTEFINLSSNQFTLEEGKYKIEIEAPAYNVFDHKAKLYNVSDATDAILGQNSRVISPNGAISNANVKGILTLSTSKTFEVRHRCSSTSSAGFGSAMSFGDDEIYTVVTITKLK